MGRKATGEPVKAKLGQKGTSLVSYNVLNRALEPFRSEVLVRQREDKRLQEQLDEAGQWIEVLQERILALESTWYRRLWRWLRRKPAPGAVEDDG